MPRPRFSNWPVADTFVVSATGSQNIDVDLIDTFYPQFLVIATYAVTSSPAGLTLTVYPGFAVDASQDVQYADNGNVITDMQSPVANTGTPQIKRSAFSINPEVYPRYLRLAFANPDTANSVSVRIVGDR